MPKLAQRQYTEYLCVYCKSDVIGPNGVVFSVVAGAVLGFDQGGVIEKQGGNRVTEKAQDIESWKSWGGAMGRAPTDVEEWLGIERGGPGQGAGKRSRRIFQK